MATQKNPISPGFARIFKQALKDINSNPRQFCKEIGYSYDFTRKVYNGEVFPGTNAIALICEKLNLNVAEMTEAVEFDKAADKGWIDAAVEGDALAKELTRYWKHLSKRDRQEILDLVKIKANRVN